MIQRPVRIFARHPWRPSPLLLALLTVVAAFAGACTRGIRLPRAGDRPMAAAAVAAPQTAPRDDSGLYEETDEEAAEGQFAELVETQPIPYVLTGTLLLPDRVIEHGGLLVEDGVIQDVWAGATPASAAGRVTIATGGIILPGFIDLHNHVAYNFLPFWHAGTFFPDRYVWQGVAAYRHAVGEPYNAAKKAGLLDEMVKFGEIRALVGGTTSILGAATTSGAGILVRNIDQRTLGRDLLRTYVASVTEFGCSRGKPRCAEQAAAVAKLKASFADGSVSAIVFHVAEGIDPLSRDEFDWLKQTGLLLPQVVVTHGTAFTAEEFAEMAAAGMPLVWSPRSNLELYGQTADVAGGWGEGGGGGRRSPSPPTGAPRGATTCWASCATPPPTTTSPWATSSAPASWWRWRPRRRRRSPAVATCWGSSRWATAPTCWCSNGGRPPTPTRR
jgi:hypothetical protein